MYSKIFLQLAANRFLRLQIIVMFFTITIDWIIMPIITKLEGLYLPIYMISFFLLLGYSDGLLQPLFKRVRIASVYLFAFFLDILQIASYTVYFYDEELFTYLILGLFTLQGVTFEIARIHTIDFMQDMIDLKDYLIIRSFIISVAVIVGSLFTIAFDLFYGVTEHMFIILAIMGVAVLPLEMMLYFGFKRKPN